MVLPFLQQHIVNKWHEFILVLGLMLLENKVLTLFFNP